MATSVRVIYQSIYNSKGWCHLQRRVVITGYGCITPIGLSSEEFWDHLLKGRSGVGTITRFDPIDFQTTIAAEVENFTPADFIERKRVKRMARFTQFGIAASRQAVQHAQIDLNKLQRERFGVIVGTGSGGLELIQQELKKIEEKGHKRLSPYLAPSMLSNIASGEISITFGAKGPSAAIVTACATGSSCIGEAMRMIQFGTTDIMLAGGTEAPITPLGLAAYSKIRALSRRNHEPTKASRPFDRHRDGFVAGEGAGVVVLEELEHAKARGASILAELIGYGSSTDAYHITAPSPTGDGAYLAMNLALKDAQVKPEQIDYINAHGTSTPLNDQIETESVKRVFRGQVPPMSSIKSMVGHMLGAAGAVELIASVLTLRTNYLPPTINWEEADERMDLDYVPNEARFQECQLVMSNSFGFGGHNVSLIIKKWND